MNIKNCPKCNAENSIASITLSEEYEVRGETIQVDTPLLQCKECGEEFYSPENDAFDAVYRTYRSHHNMVQPEEFKAFRERYDLTQRELSDLLGWGGATISRYENGALQDQAHDKTMRLAMDPKNLKTLILDNSSSLDPGKAQRILKQINKEIKNSEEENELCDFDELGEHVPSEYSGNQPLNINKLFSAIQFMCLNGGEFKTKINKLLFYADFLHFKEFGSSITGTQYARLPHGPVIDNYEIYLGIMVHKQRVSVVEKQFGEIIGEKIVANEQPSLDVFKTEEIETLAKVKGYFEGFTATKISDRSHQEKGYLETDNSQPISYRYAADIELD